MAAQEDLCFTPATVLREHILSRALSPVELLDAVLARVEALNPKVHAFITLDADRARQAARDAEEALARGRLLGPLHGIPVSIKDMEHTAGLRTTFGSKFLEHNVPDFDGAVAGRVRAAGGIIFGKTSTPQYGHKDMCDNQLMEATRNPWKLDRTSGASSGGAGAAVAAGLGPLAQGSDGAGSIRIPASLCGIYGLKPSYGRVPYWPNVDLWGARAHNGPMTRTVRDAALLMNVMAGPDQRDVLSIDAPKEDYLAALEGDPRGLRVAWSADFGYVPIDPEVRRIAEAAARRFSELGCEVEAVDPGWDDPYDWHRVVWHAAMEMRYGSLYDQRPEWIDASLRVMIEEARGYTTADLYTAQLMRTRFYEQARRFMDRYDLLLCPAMPVGAWRFDDPAPEIAGRPAPSILDRVQFMYPFNLTGWPAATVPCGFTAEGLPVGLQIVAGWHRDALALRASAAFEALQPWADRRPAL